MEQLERSLKTLHVVGLGLGLTPEMSVFRAGKCDGDIFVTVCSHSPSDCLIYQATGSLYYLSKNIFNQPILSRMIYNALHHSRQVNDLN